MRWIALLLLLLPTTAYSWGVGMLGSSPVVEWDLMDEPFTGDWESSWADGDEGDAVSEESPVGELRLDANSAGAPSVARRSKDFGTAPDTFTVKIEVEHDDIGGHNDSFRLQVFTADEYFYVRCMHTNLHIYDTGSGWTAVGSGLPKEAGAAEEQTWWFLVTYSTLGNGICDVYLSDTTHTKSLVGNDIPCSVETAYIDGRVELMQFGVNTADQVSHVDYIKIRTGLHAP